MTFIFEHLWSARIGPLLFSLLSKFLVNPCSSIQKLIYLRVVSLCIETHHTTRFLLLLFLLPKLRYLVRAFCHPCTPQHIFSRLQKLMYLFHAFRCPSIHQRMRRHLQNCRYPVRAYYHPSIHLCMCRLPILNLDQK